MSQTEVQLIKDAVIVNADISNSAAIDVSKISGALPAAGGTITGDVTFDGATAGRDIIFDRSDNALEFADNAKAAFGSAANGDMAILHDGTDSIIDNQTGNLFLRSNSTHLQSLNGENKIVAEADGAVELYHNNVKKFETTSGGATLTGTLLPGANNTYSLGSSAASWAGIHFGDHAEVRIGNASSGDLKLFHNAQDSFIRNSTGVLKIQTGTENAITATLNGAVELYHNGTKELETTSDGIAVSSDNAVVNIVSNASSTSTSFIQFRGYRIVGDVGRLGELQFINQRDNDVQAEIEAIANGDTNSYFDFKNNNAGLRTLRVQHDGTNLPDGMFAKYGNSNDLNIGHNTFNYITYANASFQITGDSTNDILLRPRSDETAAIFEPNAAVKLYYDNVLKFETTSDGTKTSGELKQFSADGNTPFRRNVYYLAIPTQTTKTITLSSLNGTGVFRAGGYTNAGQGALALHILFGGAMFATQHYQVNELINSGMQNTSISTSKNSTNYTIAITNSSTSFSLVLQIYLESTGSNMGYAVS